MTGVIARLASSLDRRDEEPNLALAQELARNRDEDAIAELIDLLANGTKPQRHDAIKVLYELGEQRPGLIAPHIDAFLKLLDGKDNRMIWGGLSALDTLVGIKPERLMEYLDTILDAADRSSVIAKDKSMHILAMLNAHPEYSTIVEPTLFDRLRHAAVNQFPMYAEFVAETVSGQGRPKLIKIVEERQAQIAYPAKKARLGKLLKKLSAA